MKNRCQLPTYAEYPNYGARGIKVCDEWQTYEPFRDWAKGNGYQENLTIDRINNDGNYEPSNCRWITNYEQQLNKRDSRYLTFNGITKHLVEWSKESGLAPEVIWKRFKKYGAVENLFTKSIFRKTESNKNTIIDLFRNGFDYKKISQMLNIKEERIAIALERWGFPRKGHIRGSYGRFV